MMIHGRMFNEIEGGLGAKLEGRARGPGAIIFYDAEFGIKIYYFQLL